ncbi:hypothetical protein ACJJIK_04560 [Microbulbifer sp. ZKSA006]|uniref:hypothetical protein n=1 Tax=Microbulbifer sp. ZKSA006 TaxID=3243390 RepID=UPI00403998F2
MKNFAIIIVLFASLAMASYEHPRWYPHKKYVASEEVSKAFDVAQEFYVKNLASSEKPIDYEFHAYAVANGYVVSISELYRVEGGGHSVAIDGEHCIYLDKNYQIKGSRQCMAAGPNPLAK